MVRFPGVFPGLAALCAIGSWRGGGAERAALGRIRRGGDQGARRFHEAACGSARGLHGIRLRADHPHPGLVGDRRRQHTRRFGPGDPRCRPEGARQTPAERLPDHCRRGEPSWRRCVEGRRHHDCRAGRCGRVATGHLPAPAQAAAEWSEIAGRASTEGAGSSFREASLPPVLARPHRALQPLPSKRALRMCRSRESSK